MKPIELQHDAPQYRDRLEALAVGIVHPACSAGDVRRDLARFEKVSGRNDAYDLRKICKRRWRALGL